MTHGIWVIPLWNLLAWWPSSWISEVDYERWRKQNFRFHPRYPSPVLHTRPAFLTDTRTNQLRSWQNGIQQGSCVHADFKRLIEPSCHHGQQLQRGAAWPSPATTFV